MFGQLSDYMPINQEFTDSDAQNQSLHIPTLMNCSSHQKKNFTLSSVLCVRSALKTCDQNGAEDPDSTAAVAEMKTRMLELLPDVWKQDGHSVHLTSLDQRV